MRAGIGRHTWLSVGAITAVALGMLAAPSMVPSLAAASTTSSATHSHTVRAGDARFEVLTPTLIRLEYAADGHFENRPTFNVINRDMPTPHFTTSTHNGVLTIRTSKLTLRYETGSGRFTRQNTSIRLHDGASAVTAHPSWPRSPGSCRFGTACEAEDGRLNAGESVNYDHTGFTGRGFAADYGQVSATDGWTIDNVPADGTYALQLRYANGGSDPTSLTATVNGSNAAAVNLPPTADWNTWGVATLPVQLHAGHNTVATTCTANDGCNVNLDSVAVTATGGAYPTTSTTPPPPTDQPGQLGGWLRGLDAYPNQAGNDITKYQLHPGILNRRGWSLLDDTTTALRTKNGWARPRPSHTGAYQDGYFFGYGRNYKRALRDLHDLTGPADMLPKWAAGVWFSEYNAFTTSDYEKQLIPAFRSNHVPLDVLVADTDWKSPQQWDGWNWNPDLFPHPRAFLKWAKQQHLHVTLNVHAGIDGSDPKFAQTQQTAGGTLQHAAQCFSPDCYRFDWSDRKQAKAWFDLHQPFERQGVRQWWLDWCCTDSYVGMPGLTPDSWINELYARDRNADGLRGFILARIGASFEDYRGDPASGPWGEHRSTVHFTGDTDPTWASLRFESQFSQDEASIGEPYVSDDIGSFKGKHLPDDMYARWVQLGAFQPVLRLHSDHGDRLPWQYGAGRQPAADALRLREALVPYTYTQYAKAYRTGLPVTRPLYLDYPSQSQAYTHPGEYLYGPEVLVAPVTKPGDVATRTVWFPPGRWTDYFTGATFTGPTTATIKVPLDRMPVFVKSGGIVPEHAGQNVDARPHAPLDLHVYSGGNGRFTLYEDSGEGHGYAHSQSRRTPFSYHEAGSKRSQLTVDAARGTYPGAVARRAYRVDLADVSRPEHVTVDGAQLARRAANGTGAGWWYDAATATLHVRTARLSVTRSHSIAQRGGRSVPRPETAALALSLNPSTPTTLDSGASTTVKTTVTDAGPDAARHVAVSLTAPKGWTVRPAGRQHAGRLAADGGSATQSWTVTAPSTGSPSTASLVATATYTDAATGAPGTLRTSQDPAANLPPVASSLTPTSAAAGDEVTIHGSNFGASQGDPSSNYVFFSDGDTSWGAPFDGAAFTVDSWSDTAITFTVPEPSGTNGEWHVTPGTTASVSVTTTAGSTDTLPLQITG